MLISKIGFAQQVSATTAPMANQKIDFSQKADSISFNGRKAIDFYQKGILQNALNRCQQKEQVEKLLKEENGLYKYKPFETFEILTQIKKPNFAENLEKLSNVRFTKYKELSGELMAEILASSDGYDIDKRIELMQTLEKYGAKSGLFIKTATVDAKTLEKISELAKGLKEETKTNTPTKVEFDSLEDLFTIKEPSNNEEIFKAIRRELPYPNIIVNKNHPQYHWTMAFAKRNFKDSLEKEILSGKYPNITPKALKNYKEDYFNNYVALHDKAEKIPQCLEMIDFLIGIHKKDKDYSWLKHQFSFEEIANIYLQENNPSGRVAMDLNRLFFGNPSKTLTKRLEKFQDNTGIHLDVDNNLPIEQIDKLEAMIPELADRYKPLSTIMAISDLTSRIAAGFNINSLIVASPKSYDFDQTIHHECAHYTHKYYIPTPDGSSLLSAFDELDPHYFHENPEKAAVAKRIFREYSTKNQAEFVADFNAAVATGVLHVLDDGNGGQIIRKYLKPNDKTTKEDLDTLVGIYEDSHGFPIKSTQAPDTNLPYVETEFPYLPTPFIVRIACANRRKPQSI